MNLKGAVNGVDDGADDGGGDGVDDVKLQSGTSFLKASACCEYPALTKYECTSATDHPEALLTPSSGENKMRGRLLESPAESLW